MATFTLNVPSVSQNPRATEGTGRAGGWRTILFNCDCHSFQEVATQLVNAIHCDFQRGLALANVVHLTGSATVYQGSRESCDGVARTLGAIGLKVSVTD